MQKQRREALENQTPNTVGDANESSDVIRRYLGAKRGETIYDKNLQPRESLQDPEKFEAFTTQAMEGTEQKSVTATGGTSSGGCSIG